ncbi:putative holin-like toxin, partial [Enterococcus faecium]
MKGVSLLSAYETIQTILGFGMFTIALISGSIIYGTDES